MNGLIKTTAAGLFGAAGLVSLAGCYAYREHVDPCWPERYNAVARHSVRDTMNAQAGNGHILDQTIWNWQFEVDPVTKAPTDKLNAAGIEHLKYLARRRPAPDCKIYVQTAQDLLVDAKNPADAQGQSRSELDSRRSAAIQRFMNDYNAGRNVAFFVEVIDAADPSIASTPIAGTARQNSVTGAYQKLNNNYQGVLPANGGQGATGSGAPGATGGATN